MALNNVLNQSGKAYKNLGEMSDEATKKIQSDNDKMIESLNRLSGAYYGLEDKTVAALEKSISLRKERMEAQAAAGQPYRLEDIEEIQRAEEELRGIRLGRTIKTTSEIMAWARQSKGYITGEMGALGITPPVISYPQLEQIAPSARGAVQTFNFNFSGAFIGNKDAFIAEIIRIINRTSELKSLAGL
jgi:hypothetical protein